jgi:hypothetical protein
MSSLAEIPELIGFFSYSREDDDDSQGALSALRDRIQRELRGQLGRTRADFRLWQDKAAISHGALWEDEIKSAVAQSVFFIPIVTPSTIRSQHCKFEFELFLGREAELDRRDLIFPILYIRVPALEDERQWRQNDVLNVIGSRQYINWQPMRHLDVGSPEVALQVERFCQNIFKALQQPWLPPDERRKSEAAEAARRAQEEERRQKDQADARQQASDDQRRREAEAQRQAAEETRRKTETAEKATAAAEQERRKAATAAAADAARRQAKAAASNRTVAADDAAPLGLQSQGPADWLDIKSWPYAWIAIAGAVLGILAQMMTLAGLNGVPLLGTRIYVLSLPRAIYAAAIVLLVARLTAMCKVPKQLLLFLALYVVATVSGALVTLFQISFGSWGLVPGYAIDLPVKWLLIATVFWYLRDVGMIGIAAAIGALGGLIYAIAVMTLPPPLGGFAGTATYFALSAVCVAYGIRRQQRPAV